MESRPGQRVSVVKDRTAFQWKLEFEWIRMKPYMASARMKKEFSTTAAIISTCTSRTCGR